MQGHCLEQTVPDLPHHPYFNRRNQLPGVRIPTARESGSRWLKLVMRDHRLARAFAAEFTSYYRQS